MRRTTISYIDSIDIDEVLTIGFFINNTSHFPTQRILSRLKVHQTCTEMLHQFIYINSQIPPSLVDKILNSIMWRRPIE